MPNPNHSSNFTLHAYLEPYPAMKDSGVEWLGEVPAHWEVKRLKTIVHIRYGLGQPPRESSEGLPLIRATNVDHGRIVEKNLVHVDPSDVPISRNAFLTEGEIIVVRSGAYTADSAIIPKAYNGAVAGYDMVVTVREAQPEFIALGLLSAYVRDDQLIIASMRSAQPHLNAEELGIAVIVLPPLHEQTAIVRFLEHVDRRIRRYIRAKQKLIGLLEKQKQAIIHRAVTRGLPVAAAAQAGRDPDVPLKPSGVEWLGDVPLHWEVTRLKRVSRIQAGYAFPADLFGDAGTPVVRMNNIRRGTLDFEQVVRIPEHHCKAAFAFSEGDVVYGLSGSIGATGSLGNYAVVRSGDLPAQLNQRVARFQPDTGCVTQGFLVESLQTAEFYEQVLSHTTGTAQFNVSTNDIGNVSLALPPLNEQKQIVRQLELATASIATAIDRARRGIELLHEYRTRLIADVVTGKLDVREAAAYADPPAALFAARAGTTVDKAANMPGESEEPEPLDETDALGDADEEAEMVEE